MACSFINNSLCHHLQRIRLDNSVVQLRHYMRRPVVRYPSWFVRKERAIQDDYITQDNKIFINEVIQDKFSPSASKTGAELSPLISQEVAHGHWSPGTRRVGLIVKKIGDYPMWMKDGKKVTTSLLQVVDNHVIKYIPPEEFHPKISKTPNPKTKMGCLLVGSDTVDPTRVTKQYYGLFKDTGLLPKKIIHRFMVHPNAALSPGTPLYANHFRVGDAVDIRGCTIGRGFQGVMKRWGFKGMPASHGVTKTHRRGGNIGGGGEKGRVWPGTKMPGHMGNRWRTLRGATILRINTKYNVIWVKGVALPGGTNSFCYMFDTVLPLRKLQSPPPFPTYVPGDQDEPEEYYDESIHPFTDETILYPDTEK